MLILATASGCLVATAADAQSSGRYMTWANRPASTTPADVQAAQAAQAQADQAAQAQAALAQAPTGFIPRRVAQSQGFGRPVMQAPAQPAPVSQGLTPASAWIGPRVTPAYSPSAPNPVAYAAAEMDGPALYPPSAPSLRTPDAPAPMAAASAMTARVAPAPVADPVAPRLDAPMSSPQRPATNEQVPEPAPVSSAASDSDPADPMAPRRDARIFQMQQPAQGDTQQAALTQPTSTRAGQTGSRYYSVHRAAGRAPDPTVLPEPVYFDSVNMDLAEPPVVEVPLRDAQGRRRIVASEDPSLP